jgi:hypothetical protein
VPTSKPEQVLQALTALLETVPNTVVERNSALPEKIPDGGLIILRDGDPGEPEQSLGGFGSTYYQHAVEVEIYLEEGDAAARDAAFDDLLQQVAVSALGRRVVTRHCPRRVLASRLGATAGASA